MIWFNQGSHFIQWLMTKKIPCTKSKSQRFAKQFILT